MIDKELVRNVTTFHNIALPALEAIAELVKSDETTNVGAEFMTGAVSHLKVGYQLWLRQKLALAEEEVPFDYCGPK